MARWDWTEDDAVRAFQRAAKGHGRQLARLLKATSEDDLADALSRHPVDLRRVVSHCLGRREERRRWRGLRRQFRRGLETPGAK